MGIVEFLRQIPDIHFTEKEKMADKTSLKVGGAARYFVMPETVYSTRECVKRAKEYGVKYKVVGNGTNILVSDRGYDGLIICTKNLNGVLLDRGEVIALCGTPLNRLVTFTKGCGRSGAEGLIGIPATVGGAIYENASAFNYSVSDNITEVTALSDGEIKRYKKSECKFGYRTSIFKNNGEFILSARFSFPKKRAVATDFNKIRRDKQPAGNTCGSIFKNPPDAFAGELIEKANLKGYRIGGATVSDKHANFIVTENGATARDVYNLIQKIKSEVYERFGVQLVEEVEFIGEF